MPFDDIDEILAGAGFKPRSQPTAANSKAQSVINAAKKLGVDPLDYATAISYETGGTFDPWQAGPTTKWGQHRGTIQYGEPQAKQYGVHQGQSFEDQVENSNVRYLRDRGVKPGDGLDKIYKAINGGSVKSSGNASDGYNTINGHIAKMKGDHRKKAAKFLGISDGDGRLEPNAADINDILSQSQTSAQPNDIDDILSGAGFKPTSPTFPANQPLATAGTTPEQQAAANAFNAQDLPKGIAPVLTPTFPVNQPVQQPVQAQVPAEVPAEIPQFIPSAPPPLPGAEFIPPAPPPPPQSPRIYPPFANLTNGKALQKTEDLPGGAKYKDELGFEFIADEAGFRPINRRLEIPGKDGKPKYVQHEDQNGVKEGQTRVLSLKDGKEYIATASAAKDNQTSFSIVPENGALAPQPGGKTQRTAARKEVITLQTAQTPKAQTGRSEVIIGEDEPLDENAPEAKAEDPLFESVVIPLEARSAVNTPEVAQNVKIQHIADTISDKIQVPKEDVTDYYKAYGFTDLVTGNALPEEKLFAQPRISGVTESQTDFVNITQGDVERIKAFSQSKARLKSEFESAKADFIKAGNDEDLSDLLAKQKLRLGNSEELSGEIEAYTARRNELAAGYREHYRARFGQTELTEAQEAEIEERAGEEARMNIKRDVNAYGSLVKMRQMRDEWDALPAGEKLKAHAATFGRVVPTMIASTFKAVGMMENIVPKLLGLDSSVIGKFGKQKLRDADKTELYKIGDAYEWARDELMPANPLAQESYVTPIVDGITQAVVQGGLAWATGGATVPGLVGLGQGGAAQYDEARTRGAGERERLVLGVVGGMVAMPDIFLMKGWFKNLTTPAKQSVFKQAVVGTYRELRDKVGEAEAKSIVRSGFAAMLTKAETLGMKLGIGAAEAPQIVERLTIASGTKILAKSIPGETVQEVSENKGNKLAEKYFNPAVKWSDIITLNKEDLMSAIGGAAGGGAGGTIQIVTQHLKERKFSEAQSALTFARKNGDITPQQFENMQTALIRVHADTVKADGANLPPAINPVNAEISRDTKDILDLKPRVGSTVEAAVRVKGGKTEIKTGAVEKVNGREGKDDSLVVNFDDGTTQSVQAKNAVVQRASEDLDSGAATPADNQVNTALPSNEEANLPDTDEKPAVGSTVTGEVTQKGETSSETGTVTGETENELIVDTASGKVVMPKKKAVVSGLPADVWSSGKTDELKKPESEKPLDQTNESAQVKSDILPEQKTDIAQAETAQDIPQTGSAAEDLTVGKDERKSLKNWRKEAAQATDEQLQTEYAKANKFSDNKLHRAGEIRKKVVENELNKRGLLNSPETAPEIPQGEISSKARNLQVSAKEPYAMSFAEFTNPALKSEPINRRGAGKNAKGNWGDMRPSLTLPSKPYAFIDRSNIPEFGRFRVVDGFEAKHEGKNSYFQTYKEAQDFLKDLHKEYIQEAISEGKTIPSEILADHPDLAEKYASQKSDNVAEKSIAENAKDISEPDTGSENALSKAKTEVTATAKVDDGPVTIDVYSDEYSTQDKNGTRKLTENQLPRFYVRREYRSGSTEFDVIDSTLPARLQKLKTPPDVYTLHDAEQYVKQLRRGEAEPVPQRQKDIEAARRRADEKQSQAKQETADRLDYVRRRLTDADLVNDVAEYDALSPAAKALMDGYDLNKGEIDIFKVKRDSGMSFGQITEAGRELGKAGFQDEHHKPTSKASSVMFARSEQSDLKKELSNAKTESGNVALKHVESDSDKRNALLQMQPVEVNLSVLGGLKGDDLRIAAKKEWDKLKELSIKSKDGRKISFTNTGFEEIRQHSADPKTLQIVSSLPDLIAKSTHLWSEPVNKPNKPNLLEFHNYGVKATFGNNDYIIRLSFREDSSKNNVHYDQHLTEVEILQEPLTKPNRNANPGESQEALAKDRLYEWWNSVKNPSLKRIEESAPEPLLAPNGKPSNLTPFQHAQVRTPQFLNWFGDWLNDPENASKVVDENGEPMVVYHGSKSDVDKFTQEKVGGFWFSATPDYANELAAIKKSGNADANITPTFLNIRNFDIDKTPSNKFSDDNYEKPLIEKAKNEGKDGIAFQTQDEYADTFYVAFKPNQIKSVFNNGEFSPDNDSILKRAERESTQKEFHEIKFASPAELVEKGTVERNGDRVKVNLEGQEFIRRVMEEIDIRAGRKKIGSGAVETSFSGLFTDSSSTLKLEKTLRDISGDATKAGANQAAEFAAKLANEISAASEKGAGTAVLYMYDSRLPHEVFHQASYLGDLARNLITRHQNFDKLKAHPVFKATADYFREFAEYRSIEETNPKMFDALVAEESAAYIAGGERGLLGVSKEDAADYLTEWFDSYAAKNGIESLDKFAEIEGDTYDAIQRIRQAHAEAKQSDAGRETQSDGGSSQIEQSPNSERSEPGRAREGESGNNRESRESEQGLKKRGVPKSLEQRGYVREGEIVGEAAYYEQKNRDSTKRAAESEVEKIGLANAINRAVRPVEKPSAEEFAFRMATAELLFNQADQSLENGDGITAQAKLDSALEVIESLSKDATAAGQANSQLAAWQRTNPTTVPLYVQRKRARIGYRETLTPGEIKQLKEDAENAAKANAVLAETKSKLEDADKEISHLTKTLGINEVKNQTFAADLSSLKRQLGYWKKKALGELKERKSSDRKLSANTKQLYKDLLGRQDDITARLSTRFGADVALKMVAGEFDGKQSLKRVEDNERESNLTPEDFQTLVDFASLEILRDTPFEELEKKLSAITNGEASASVISDIHLEAFEATHPAGKEVSTESKETAKIRSKHAAAAKKHRDQTRLQNIRRIPSRALEIITRGKNSDTPDNVITAALYLETNPRMAADELARALRADDDTLQGKDALDIASKAARFRKTTFDDIRAEKATKLSEKEKLEKQELAAGVKAGAAARTLNRRVDALAAPPPSYYNRVIGIMKSAMVSAYSTSQINFLGAQVGRKMETTGDLFELAINKGLKNVFDYDVKHPDAIPASTAISDILGYTGKVGGTGITQMVKRDAKELAAAARLAYSGEPDLASVMRSKAQKVLNENPTEYERLFKSFNSDIQMRQFIESASMELSDDKNIVAKGLENVANAAQFITNKPLDAAEWFYDKMNFLNKLQEFWMRDMEFTRALQKQLGGRGLKLDDIIEMKEWDKIKSVEIARAVDAALKITFAKRAPKDSVVGGLSTWLHTKPVTRHITPFVFPFANFTYNAIDFVGDFAPGYGLVKQSRKNAKADNSSFFAGMANLSSRDASKQMVGMVMFLSALGLVRALGDDDDWKKIRVPGMESEKGKPLYLDATNWFPVTPFIFMANKMNRLMTGKPMFSDKKKMYAEILEGLANISQRNVADNQLLESLKLGIKWATSSGGDKEDEKLWFVMRKFAGSQLGTLTQPLKVVRDVTAKFIASEREMADLADSPFLAGLTRNLPFQKEITGAESKKRLDGSPIVVESPVLRIFGLNVQNPDFNKSVPSYALAKARELAPDFSSEKNPLPSATRKKSIKGQLYSLIREAGQDKEAQEKIKQVIKTLVSNGTFTEKELSRTESMIGLTDLQQAVKYLSMDENSVKGNQIEQVLKLATPEELKELEPILKKKAASAAKSNAATANSPDLADKLRKADTDSAVELFTTREDNLTDEQKRLFRGTIKAKADNAARRGTLTAEELETVRKVLPDYKPPFVPKRFPSKKPDKLAELRGVQ